MFNKPNSDDLKNIPRLYETETIETDDKIVYAHFFIGGSDWYAMEFDGDDTFFGYAVLNGDTQNAELGYFLLSELSEINIKGFEVDRDLYWEPKKFSEVRREKNL